MARRERHHAARRVLHALLALVVLLAAVAAGVGVTAWRRSDPGPAPSPAEARLDLPPVVAPGDPSEVPATSGPAGSRVRAALAEALADPALGAHVTLAVAGGIGDPVLTEGRGPVVPASTTKLLTSLAALSLVDPGTTFDTMVVRSGSRVVLVGGGDPFLAGRPDPSAYPHRADLQTLAARTARALLADGVRQVRLGYDDSLFSGPALSPHWPADYVADDVVSPISALWVDEGRLEPGGIERVADPALVAATDFAAALRTRGLRVAGPPVDATAPDSAERLARVSSAPIGEIVQQTLQASDNEAAEVLLRHVGLAADGRGSFAGGVAGVRAVLDDLGLPRPVRLYDGSGLSRDNALTPATLVAVLQAAVTSDDDSPLRDLLAGLPVAGFTGSLADRFDLVPPAARGVARAKTGTLSGVSALAGVTTDRDGRLLVFAIMADRVALADGLTARVALDRAVAALSTCRCGSPVASSP